ncbi:DUF262 domain-containing protein [uncultured Microbacterium sp.]|uniref:DUF262 domain-containing protein n=1 Tax=uncultured Microbacterium sp. TaxID=191216 RepID=UPI0028D7083D|nr:DUF262 domain-containing protein [uncultured Microbacterium sp.]
MTADRRDATNVDATAVNTMSWLSGDLTVVVPVYQRQYRWDIGACEQLLSDVRAVADSDHRHMHFLGSILSSVSGRGEGTELVLIDGQQRLTTLMLLVAALHHTVRSDDPALAAELERVLVRRGDRTRTKLRPHRGWADVFESVVLDRLSSVEGLRESRFDDNYAFFRSQISRSEAPQIWAGLQKLEHVSITLGAGANAQQIFESLNSTGEPLRDHELIHNYVLMGLSHAEQSEIEQSFWVPIEQNTGEAIQRFWRHYLVMRTGREVAVTGGRGVYEAFRSEFPRLEPDDLRAYAAEWKEYSEIYRVLLDPAHADDLVAARELAFLNLFGGAVHPLMMRVYRDHTRGAIDFRQFLATIADVQSLLLRRTVVGTPTESLVARLCRAREEGTDELRLALGRITPSDERVRVALKYGELPHPRQVLGRLAGADPADELDVDHIFPTAPGDAWSGDGVRAWAQYTEDEQNSHRALAQTLGNLTLVEQPLAERAWDQSFAQKRVLYGQSRVSMTSALTEFPAWDTAAIVDRTAALTAEFVRVWPRPGDSQIDDDGLTPILDARRRRGWPPGWQREFSYVEYRGEHWEVHDVKALFNRIFRRMWTDARPALLAFNDRRGGPVYPAQSWNGQWDALDEAHFLYMGWDSRYMLTAVQDVLEEAGFAAEVFVKYSYIGDAMK